MNKPKKILVTGSLGYIGSVLTPYLKDRGYDVIGYDTGFFEDCTLYPPNQKIKTVKKDVREIVEKDIEDIDVLIHLAGLANDPFGKLEPEKVFDPIREYTFNLAKLCKKMAIRFIFASSCSVYGKGQDELLDENSQTFPQSPYSLNKLQSEEDLKKISDGSFSPVALRISTLFGMSPRIRFDLVINMFIGMAMSMKEIVLNSDGKAWRPYIHILDLCAAFKQTIELNNDTDDLMILNVGDERNNFKVIDIAKIVQSQFPGCGIKFLYKYEEIDRDKLYRDKKIQDGVDKRTYSVSFKKIKTLLNAFNCEWTVEKGISGMKNKLNEIGLTDVQFKNINFYRLQKFDYLYKNNFISDNMFWKK